MRFLWQKTRAYVARTDKYVWLFCLLVSLAGVVLLYGVLQSGYGTRLSIGNRNLLVQCIAIGLGVLAAFILSITDYHLLVKAWVVHLPLSYLLLLLTFFIGVGAALRPDDKRWLIVPGINMWVQPAELLKISFILVFALHIHKLGEGLNSLPGVASLLGHAVVPIVIIHFQGDDGTALLIATIAVTMLFAAGINWKYILSAAVAAVAAVPALWFLVLDDFQKERILMLVHPSNADPLGGYYQQYQSKIAIAMGGMTGTGLLDVRHTYVPEMHNDFIFSFLCESFGFMGALAVLAVMVALCLRILYNSFRAQDAIGSMICVGVFAMIMFQFFINVGMCLSALPVIGNTFPFLSSGGSSVLTNYLGIGLVLSVHMRRKGDLFSS